MKKMTATSLFFLIALSFTTSVSGQYCDFDGDGKTGIQEAMIALQLTAGIRLEENKLLGVWGFGDTNGYYNTILFFKNGFYIINGKEYGTYDYNTDTGTLGLTVLRDHNGQGGFADCAIPYNDKIIINGDHLDLYQDDSFEGSFYRVLEAISPIVGMWTKTFAPDDIATLHFYPNGQYVVDHNGLETGLYTHDKNTGEFQVTVISDENGQYGFADNGEPYEGTWFVSGNTLTILPDEVTFGRVHCAP